MRGHGSHSISSVPAVVTAILQSPNLPTAAQFDSVSYGGAPSPERMAKDLRGRFPSAMITHGYGMSECNAVHTVVTGDDFVARGGSVGPVIPIGEVRITDSKTRRVLPPRMMGVIEIRGSNVMKEYVGEPAATAAVLDKDGWLNTGDVGLLDDEGYLYIRDRGE